MAESAESAESAEPDEPTTLLRLAPVGTLAIVAVWGLLSVLGSRAWQSDRALWAAAYEVRPEDPRVILRLGDALGRAGEGRAEYALYLEHLDALEHAEEVPVALPVYLERSGDVVAAEAWYATAFAKPTKQPEGLYTHYLEFIARHPERHDPNRDDVLRYALPGYLGSERAQQLGLAELAELQRHAARLGIRRQRSTGPT